MHTKEPKFTSFLTVYAYISLSLFFFAASCVSGDVMLISHTHMYVYTQHGIDLLDTYLPKLQRQRICLFLQESMSFFRTREASFHSLQHRHCRRNLIPSSTHPCLLSRSSFLSDGSLSFDSLAGF